MKAAAVLSALLVVLLLPHPAVAQNLRIYHIDVEQGDATLFVSPVGHTLLVDSGKNGHGPPSRPWWTWLGWTPSITSCG